MVSCGGGGGGSDSANTPSLPGSGGTPSNPSPTVSISTSSSNTLLDTSVTLTWTSTNASSCSASGDWSGSKSISGSEELIISKLGNNNFSLNCTGTSGDASSSLNVNAFRNMDGVVVDGYISGATVFIDENSNDLLDSSENSYTSDNNGKFLLPYSDGVLISSGGMDAATQIQLDNFYMSHDFTEYSDMKVITPITTLAGSMNEPSNINLALGIDASINIYQTDPFKTRNDSDINLHLYQIGNQLTIFSIALQNISNDLSGASKNTKDFFNLLSKQIEKDFNEKNSMVNLVSQDFISKTLDLLIETENISLLGQTKIETVNALSVALPLVQVQSNDSLSNSVLNFYLSTFQDDIKSVASGAASQDLILNYSNNQIYSYISRDQQISANDIKKSPVQSLGINVSSVIETPENQATVTTITITSPNPESSVLTIEGKDANEFFINENLDLSFNSSPDYESKNTYEISLLLTLGNESVTSDLTIKVTNVNDISPVFGVTEFTVDEKQTDIGLIDVTDLEGDPLSLSLSGGDSDAFELNSSFRTIKFKQPPLYSEKAVYETVITASDGVFLVDQTLKVNLLEISQLAENHPQAILGTDGDDVLEGNDDQYDILIGGKGNDTITGGDNRSPFGGYLIDIFQFGDNSGQDTIKDFFIQELYEEGQGTGYGEVDGMKRSDRIEIIIDINGTGTSTANDILSNSSNNSSGHAVLNLGQGNSIELEGVSLNSLKPEYIHIISQDLKLFQGSDDDDVVVGDKRNSRLEGSNDPFDRFEDGADILVGSSGDDVLIGGTNDSSVGGFLIDQYWINNNSGDDLIIGYFDSEFDSGASYNNPQGSGARNDKILLPYGVNNSAIDTFYDLQTNAINNADGWAKVDLTEDNSITFHGVPLDKLKPDSFIFVENYNFNFLYGNDNNNFLNGGSGNDWIQGSLDFLGRFGDGIDYIFPNAGNDILLGGSISISTTSDQFFTNNFFINNTGFKTIIGFSGTASDSYNPNTNNMLDRLFIQRNSNLSYLSDLQTLTNDDSFLELIISDESKILLHGIKDSEVGVNNIILHDQLDNYEFGSLSDDILMGTSNNDYIDGWGEYILQPGCSGISTGDDVLDGKAGNDVLIGGDSTHFCGGYNRDTFVFAANSGQDIIVDFTSNFEHPGLVNTYSHMDVLQIEESINGLTFRHAQDLIDISTDNVDGFAEINLGANNSIALHGKSLSTISPMHFRIIPKVENYIYGTDDDDVVIGTDENDYLFGSRDTLDRFEDGHDILDPGKGDDALDGGEFKSPFGGYIIDIYKFDRDYGFNRVFGFSAADIYEGYGGSGYTSYETGIKSDKIEIPNDVVESATSLINLGTNNIDGWAELSFEGTTIVLHMLPIANLKPDYFLIVPRTSNTIIGTDDGDNLIGTNANDRIQGSSDPFGRFEDGPDLLVGGEGNDILIGGPAKSSVGGYYEDRYRFSSNFGNDVIISFFAEDLVDGGGYDNPDGEGALQSDRLEFSNTLASSAQEIIINATSNDDGWTQLNLGSNSVTIFGLKVSDLKPDYFHIIPEIDNTIIGTDEDDQLIGTSSNDYIEGSDDSFGRFEDGSDLLEGKEGDDVLVGGPNRRSTGGYKIDTYKFEDNSGNDLILGFLFDGTGYVNEYNDVIELPYNVNGSGISSFNNVLAATTNNADGWAVINLGSGNSITLHGVAKSKLLARNFNITGTP